MNHLSANAEQIADWIKSDPERWELLGYVRDLALPDCWIAAGFVRNAVWNILHARPAEIQGDVDVIWYDQNNTSEARDQIFESILRGMAPAIKWSVKNQARMHSRNSDDPYASSEDAMRFWPETATAVGARRTAEDQCEIIAPFALDDLMMLRLRPAGAFADRKRAIFEERVRQKAWLCHFPKLNLVG